MNLLCKLLVAACFCAAAPAGWVAPAAKAEISQTYFATAKPKPKPRTRSRSDWATVQQNLECPPPARPACGR